MRAQDRAEHRKNPDRQDIRQYKSLSMEELITTIDEGTDCVNCLDVPHEFSNVPEIVRYVVTTIPNSPILSQ